MMRQNGSGSIVTQRHSSLSVLTQISAKKYKGVKKERQQETYFGRKIVKLLQFFKFRFVMMRQNGSGSINDHPSFKRTYANWRQKNKE